MCLDDDEMLQEVLRGALVHTETRTRGRIADLVQRLSHGEGWHGAMIASRASWAQVQVLRKQYPALHSIIKAAEDVGKRIRQAHREAEADRRAMEGWDEPIVWRGEVTGEIRRYSDRLLELQLRAGDPEKYGHPGGAGGAVNVNNGLQVVYRIEGVQRSLPATEIDRIEAAMWRRGDTKTIQGQAETQERPRLSPVPTDSVSVADGERAGG
jgi:hypothetical protein